MVEVDEEAVEMVPERTAKPPPARNARSELRASQPGHDSSVLLELVDGFAWMPLKVPAQRVELLEALTASGAFDNAEVCTTVAAEMCALDKGAAVTLVDKLTRRLRTYPAGRI